MRWSRFSRVLSLLAFALGCLWAKLRALLLLLAGARTLGREPGALQAAGMDSPPGSPGGSIDGGEGHAAAPDPIKTKGLMETGCEHYRRRCKLVAPCCGEVFWCRHCHNVAKNDDEEVSGLGAGAGAERREGMPRQGMPRSPIACAGVPAAASKGGGRGRSDSEATGPGCRAGVA